MWVAGLKIDGAAFSRSRMSYYTDMSLFDIDQVVPGPDDMKSKFTGLPEDMWLNSVSYSKFGTKIAFTARSPGGPKDPPRSASELWIIDLETQAARPILKDAPCKLNTIFQEWDKCVIRGRLRWCMTGINGWMRTPWWHVVFQRTLGHCHLGRSLLGDLLSRTIAMASRHRHERIKIS